MTIHRMTVGYASEEFSIRLFCHDCQHTTTFPNDPTVGALVEAYAEHQRTIDHARLNDQKVGTAHV